MIDLRSFQGLGIIAALTLTAGCGGSQPPINALVAMTQGHAVAANDKRPVANPTSLFFYSRHPLKFTVTQTGYYGRFTMSDYACVHPNGIARVSPKSARGPSATFKVTPIESPSGGGCVVTVANAQGRKAKVSVGNPGY
jgi:hypothetical protein